MTNTTTLALVAALLLGSTSMSLAQERFHPRHHAVASQSLESRNVALPQAPSAAEEEWMDRASQTWDSGGR
jgi:hypothetical protein